MDDEQLKQLMRLVALRQDKAAFSELFDLLAPKVKSRLLRLGVSAAESEDVVQDVMISLWTKAGLYDVAKGSVMAWVFVIARNARIDRLRRTKPHMTVELLEYDDTDPTANAEEQSISNADAKAISKGVAGLAPEQRDVINLVFGQELTQAEVATKLNLPLGTVKSRMRLAYGHLRKVMEKTA